jgi:hypothetical protein
VCWRRVGNIHRKLREGNGRIGEEGERIDAGNKILKYSPLTFPCLPVNIPNISVKYFRLSFGCELFLKGSLLF